MEQNTKFTWIFKKLCQTSEKFQTFEKTALETRVHPGET